MNCKLSEMSGRIVLGKETLTGAVSLRYYVDTSRCEAIVIPICHLTRVLLHKGIDCKLKLIMSIQYYSVLSYLMRLYLLFAFIYFWRPRRKQNVHIRVYFISFFLSLYFFFLYFFLYLCLAQRTVLEPWKSWPIKVLICRSIIECRPN
jgi:hypothetical protein